MITLPCEKTLRNAMRNMEITPGICSGIIDMMKIKVQGINEDEKMCNLLVDEMLIKKKPSIQSYILDLSTICARIV